MRSDIMVTLTHSSGAHMANKQPEAPTMTRTIAAVHTQVGVEYHSMSTVSFIYNEDVGNYELEIFIPIVIGTLNGLEYCILNLLKILLTHLL